MTWIKYLQFILLFHISINAIEVKGKMSTSRIPYNIGNVNRGGNEIVLLDGVIAYARHREEYTLFSSPNTSIGFDIFKRIHAHTYQN